MNLARYQVLLVFTLIVSISLCMFTEALSTTFKKSFVKLYPPPSKLAIQEALTIFQEKYPPMSERSPAKRLPWTSWGIPKRDIDGSNYQVGQGGTTMGPTLFEKTTSEQTITFKELSRVYGETQALEMTRIMPAILAFEKQYFEPSLVEFSKKFGEDNARAMIGRNPGLLAVKPYGVGSAESANDQTMQFSYIIAATRPYSKVLLYGTLGLVLIPTFEAIIGIPIRANIFHALMDILK